MSEEQQEEQQIEEQLKAESSMEKLAGEDLNATQKKTKIHLQTNDELEGVDPDEVEFVKPEFLGEVLGYGERHEHREAI